MSYGPPEIEQTPPPLLHCAAPHRVSSGSATGEVAVPRDLFRRILEMIDDLIPTASGGDRFGLFAAGDGGDAIWHGHQRVPGLAAGLDDGLKAGPDAQAELVLALIFPDVLDRIELGAIGRQRDQSQAQ